MDDEKLKVEKVRRWLSKPGNDHGLDRRVGVADEMLNGEDG